MRASKKQHQSLQTKKTRKRLPPWFKIRLSSNSTFTQVKSQVKGKGLATVCEEAQCPNMSECWSGGTATFMLMGDTCTRGCRFCSVKTGNPKSMLDPFEPQKLAEVIKNFNITYAVITSVTRDDLLDGGARHIAKCLNEVQKQCPEILLEILIPDFRGKKESLEIVLSSNPKVLAHNIETIERLTQVVRDGRANYRQSIEVLRQSKVFRPDILTKSSIMVGFDETEEEVIQAMKDLRDADVDIVTFGQYLAPSQMHLEVQKYVTPKQFDRYKEIAMGLGFLYCASGPMVRSSYKAGELFLENYVNRPAQPPPTAANDRTPAVSSKKTSNN